jgi:ABC-type dipeptide/oligopeptide/nickel transport system permease component
MNFLLGGYSRGACIPTIILKSDFKKNQMDAKASLLDPLLERAEQYGKTSFELLKLKSLDKTADVASTLIARILSTLTISLFALTLTIAIALYLGELLGKNYYGFFVVASFYGIVAIVLLLIHPQIKGRINNSLIKQMLN